MNKRAETLLYGIVAFVSLAMTAAAAIVIVVVLANRNRPAQATQVAAGVTVTTITSTSKSSGPLTITPDVPSLVFTNTPVPLSPSPTPEVAAPFSTTTPVTTPPMSENPSSTMDATNRSGTIRAIIDPRLTETMEQIALGPTESAREADQPSSTALPTLTETPTLSSTASPLPTITPAPQVTDSFVALSPLIEGTTATKDPTLQFATIRAIIGPRLTLTAEKAILQTATSQINDTATYAIYQTQTVPVETETETPTSVPTATLNPTETYATLLAVFNHSLTETPQAQIAGSVTAVFHSMLQSLMNQQSTATAAMVQTGLANGYDAISVQNATKLSIVLTVKNHDTSTNSIAFSLLVKS